MLKHEAEVVEVVFYLAVPKQCKFLETTKLRARPWTRILIFQVMYYLQAFIDQRTLFFVHKVAATATFAKTRILLFLGSCAAEQDVT